MYGYEESLRRVFPALYQAALRLGYDEEGAAIAAQRAFIEAYTEQDREDGSLGELPATPTAGAF